LQRAVKETLNFTKPTDKQTVMAKENYLSLKKTVNNPSIGQTTRLFTMQCLEVKMQLLD